MNLHTTKVEHKIITSWVENGASVLDLGCGDGKLLSILINEKHVRAHGIEISDEAIHSCVAAGLNVFQEDIDTGLADYSDDSFDYVILNQTFQQVKKPDYVLSESLRVGKKIIVGFPNFLYYPARVQMFFRGRVPVTPSLPYEWYNTPNLHFLSIADFKKYCQERNIQIEKSVYIRNNKQVKLFPNLLAEVGLFLLS
jgi:methionine biosynthesis protein MetW